MMVCCWASISQARTPELQLDTSIRFLKPLPCKSVRMLPSVYDEASKPWYVYGGDGITGSGRPLSRQIFHLLNNNCSDGETVSIALNELRMLFGNPSSLYIHAECFSGEPGSLRHFYTLDTIVQKSSVVVTKSSAGRLASECMLEAVRVACRHFDAASPTLYRDTEAADYYRNILSSYQLYTAPMPAPLGVYRTVDDFMNLRAIDTPLLFVHIPQIQGDGFNWFYSKDAAGAKGERLNAEDFYAASDGKNLYLSSNGTLRKIRRSSSGQYFILMTAKMVGVSTYSVVDLVDKAMSPDGRGSKVAQDVVGKFSPQQKRFLPYGGKLPH